MRLHLFLYKNKGKLTILLAMLFYAGLVFLTGIWPIINMIVCGFSVVFLYSISPAYERDLPEWKHLSQMPFDKTIELIDSNDEIVIAVPCYDPTKKGNPTSEFNGKFFIFSQKYPEQPEIKWDINSPNEMFNPVKWRFPKF